MSPATCPILFTADTLIRTGVAHRDGAIVLLEARGSLSVLLARSVEEKRGHLALNSCLWALFGPEDIGLLPLESVTISCAEFWIAATEEPHRLLRWPSVQPYLVWFPAPEHFERLSANLDELRVSTFLTEIIKVFAAGENFRTSLTGHLIAPDGYASVPESLITPSFLDIPAEFRL